MQRRSCITPNLLLPWILMPACSTKELECRAEGTICSKNSRDMLQRHLDTWEPVRDTKDFRTRGVTSIGNTPRNSSNAEPVLLVPLQLRDSINDIYRRSGCDIQSICIIPSAKIADRPALNSDKEIFKGIIEMGPSNTDAGSHKFPPIPSEHFLRGSQTFRWNTNTDCYGHLPASPVPQSAPEITLRPIRSATVLLYSSLP